MHEEKQKTVAQALESINQIPDSLPWVEWFRIYLHRRQHYLSLIKSIESSQNENQTQASSY